MGSTGVLGMATKGSSTATVLELRPYPSDLYGSMDLNRLTVFTIDLLNRLNVPTTFENIAVATFRMFPRRFAMVGYPNYPDVTRVNRALLQLRPKYRNWATGKTRLGWQLTGAGEEEARVLRTRLGDANSVSAMLQPEDLEAEPAAKTKRTVHPEETTTRIRASSLFLKYRDNWSGVEPLEVFDVLEAYTHTPPQALKQRLLRMRATALSVGDKEVTKFLDELGNRFSLLFERRR